MMRKFILTLGYDAYQLLQLESKRRGITVQQLLRAVIIPEWIEGNGSAQKGRALRIYATSDPA